MSLIDGVGDEVVQFVAVLAIVSVAALAWWSTNARPDRYRTVLVMRSHTHPITLSIRTRQPPQVNATDTHETHTTMEIGSRQSAPIISLREMDSIVDADVAMMNNHRLHFYRRVDPPSRPSSATESTSDESETHDEGGEPASHAQIREMDSIVSAMEAEANADPFPRNPVSIEPTRDVECNKEKTPIAKSPKLSPATEIATNQSNIEVSGEPAATAEPKILIKLKYLNDTLKEVEGSLDELLVDFKVRHFSRELSSQCRVRLIFEGRVLNEALTLRAAGLRDRAVVHCLVHPVRTAQRVGSEERIPGAGGAAAGVAAGGAVRGELLAEGAAAGGGERAWDFENVLMTLVSVALTVVWFFRCEYSNMFTASASVALFGLTVFHCVAIFGLYLSDTFHFERRTPPTVPTQ